MQTLHKYRPEVDGLRAVAVLPVVLFHGHIPGFSGGYLGVDVFFAISGFLITQILLGGLDEGRLSIRSFYERRARRLLPALFLMLLTSLAVGVIILPPPLLVNLAKSTVAAVFFGANFHYLQTTDYFSDPGELLPLLHTWSLAVEEQFYLLFPIALAWIHLYARRMLRLILYIAAILSIFGAYRESQIDAARGFYLLQFRAWELLAGAVVATFPRKQSKLIPPIGLLMVLAAILLLGNRANFGIGSVLVVSGTVLILGYGGTDFASRILSLRPLVYIGSISYALYLWHQPVFAFARHALMNAPSAATVASLILFSGVLAALSTHYFEQPLRRATTFRSVATVSISAAALLMIGCLLTSQTEGFTQRYTVQQLAVLNARPERGIAFVDGKSCRRPIAEACVIGAEVAPTFAVVGDSHADTLTAPLSKMLAEHGLAAFVYTNPGCPFIASVVEVIDLYHCGELMNQVLAALKLHQIKNLVVSDRSTAYIVGTRFDNGEGGVEPGAPFPVAPVGFSGPDQERLEATLAAMRSTLIELLDAGVNIYHVLPIPEVGWHVPRTLAKLTARHAPPITTSLQRYLERNAPILKLAAELSTNARYSPIYPHRVLCDNVRCRTVLDGKVLYTDTDHLSSEGAALIVPEISKLLEDNPADR
ncbi:acyltransferase family protein [Bradyrhizobium ottawaense]|uniref:acyltransferase family protein n=1 Tax=Bradyrhizobium ottawaense TaxID=931866 RepID=UPI001BA4BDAE|nr:acyltransferase family protein [Bradyrhizobium ottawaense]MBR1363446.1 acyltransferase [Bradyrhizobium ottawaense]